MGWAELIGPNWGQIRGVHGDAECVAKFNVSLLHVVTVSCQHGLKVRKSENLPPELVAAQLFNEIQDNVL